MVLGLFPAAIGIVATCALAGVSVAAGALTRWAGLAAAAVGCVVVVIGGFPYLALLVLFVFASVLATRYGFEEKKKRNVHEGIHGERGVSNVLAHAIAPMVLVVGAALGIPGLPTITTPVLYAAALSFGAADTFASEFGVLEGRARSILTFRPVTAGTNGGVSPLGEAWAFVGAVATAGIGYGLFYLFATPTPGLAAFLLPAGAAGFLACQVDSVLGETLENRGYLTKGSTNFLAMVSAILLALLLVVALGGPA